MKPIIQRQSIRQPSPATIRLSPQWKDALKQKCLERARQKRNNRVAQNRQTSPTASSSSSPGVHSYPSIQIQSTPTAGTAREFIQEQLQATGVAVLSTPSSSFHTSSNTFRTPNNANNPCVYTTPVGGFSHYSHSESDTALFLQHGRNETENYITEEDLDGFIEEIEKELQEDEGKNSCSIACDGIEPFHPIKLTFINTYEFNYTYEFNRGIPRGTNASHSRRRKEESTHDGRTN